MGASKEMFLLERDYDLQLSKSEEEENKMYNNLSYSKDKNQKKNENKMFITRKDNGKR